MRVIVILATICFFVTSHTSSIGASETASETSETVEQKKFVQIFRALCLAIVGGIIIEIFRIYVLPLFPPYQKVPRLNGTEWKYEHGTLKISQHGYGTKIKAEARRKNGNRLFKYKGNIISGQLVLTWEEPEGMGYIMGAMVLRLTPDRQRLEGMTTYFDHDEGKVVSVEREYKRINH